ncbi:MAG: tripartite tricarboxylate transporter substrate-binding protein [Halobacteriota archaeon]
MTQDTNTQFRDETTSQRRRRFLRQLGTVSGVGFLGSLAGCTGDGGSSGGDGGSSGGDGGSSGGDGGDGGSSGGDGGDGGSDYPSDDIDFIIPYSTGGGVDLWTRHLTPLVAGEFDVNVAFENIGGAGGMRGFQQTYNADPDGYTMTAGSIPLITLSWLSHEPDWDIADMSAVSMFTEKVRLMLFADPSLELGGIEDLFELYRSGEITTFGSAAQGSLESAIAYQLRDNDEYNVPWENLVEYEGSGPTLEAVASGEVAAGIATDSSASGSGFLDQVDLVCSLADQPSAPLSDYVNSEEQTLDDAGYEPFDILATYRMGYYMPPETPMEKRQTIADAVQTVMESDEHQQWQEETGNQSGPWRGPEETQQLLEDSVSTLQDKIDFDQLRG